MPKPGVDAHHESSTTSTWSGSKWNSPCRSARTDVVFAVALLTSILWYLFWVVMEPVKMDISPLVNWYIFMRFGLRQEYDVYGTFWLIGKWCPLMVISAYALAWLIQVNLLQRLQQIVCLVVAVYNLLLSVYMLVAGGKIISLFLVALPLQLVLFLRHSWWVVLLLPTAALLGYYTCQCVIASQLKSPRSQQRSCAAKKKCGTPFSAIVVGVGVILTVHTVAALSTNWLLETGCLPCETRQEVPKKPALVAHRGCDFTFPENTVAAFRESVKIPGVVAIETDIQISFDGMLFVLHDPHLVRTTDGEKRCPSVDPMANASWLNFSTGDCPLQELRVGDWYAEEEKLPTFSQYLEVAMEMGTSVIFDIREPHIDHPYHEAYINRSLEVLVSSGIDLRKVWWLAEEEREWVLKEYPAMIQVTKTEETPFEEFGKEHIQKVNDDWTTPLDTFRMYQAANVSLNMYFVDSVFIFNYAWCVGVESVTTSNCVELSKLNTNTLYQVCRELSHVQERLLVPLTVTLSLCSFSCLTCFECIRKQTRKHSTTKP